MVNFDSIKYLFEIPLGWYRKVHRACFESIGVDMVEIRPTPSGANEIGINMDDFTEAVKRVSKVKSVDGIEPNDEGDVELGAVREVDGAEPDEDGVVDFGLNGSEWMKTTADGHIGTTDEKPITLDGSSGVMYSNGNAIAYKTVGNGSSFDIASGNHTHTQYAEKAHTHKVNDITDLDLSGFLTEDDVGDAAFKDVGTTEGTVASGKHSHDLSDMKLIVPGHSGTCIVIMDNEGNLTHSGNTAYNLLNAAAETTGVSKLLTDKSIGTTKGTVAEGEHTHVMDDIVDLSEDILTVDDVGVVVAAKEHTHAEYADKVHTHTEYATVSAQEATQAVALAAGTLAQQAKDRADSAYQFASDNWGYILQVQKGVTTAQEMASSASTEAENAQATANTAKTTANTAKTTADSAKSTATTAQTTANAAKATADGLANTVSALDNEVGLLDAEVQLIADDYVTSKELANYIPKNNSATGLLYNAAGSISYKAIGTGSGQVAAGNHTHSNYATAADVEAAKSTAETAKTTANTAKSTADTAKSTADTAKSTATTAQSTATTAQSMATTAKSTADTAKATADTAKSTADTAKSTADTAKSTATTAQTTANTAQATANTAQSTADSALDAVEALSEVVGDINENYVSKDQIPTNFIQAIASRKGGSFTFVTDVQWTGTYLQKKTRTVTVTQGIITNLGTESNWTTWETPTVISWS